MIVWIPAVTSLVPIVGAIILALTGHGDVAVVMAAAAGAAGAISIPITVNVRR